MPTRPFARLLAATLGAASACALASMLAASCSAPPIITVPTPGEGGVDAHGDAQAAAANGEELPSSDAP